MADEVKASDVMVAVKELRETVKAHGVDSSDFKEKSDKMEGLFEAQEAKNQELLATQESAKKEAEELMDRVKAMELDLVKASSNPNVDYKTQPEYLALQKFYTHGATTLDVDEMKTLRTDVDTQGGYLTTPEMDNVILKEIVEVSPMRSFCRVRTVSKKQLEMPKRTSIPTATYEGEGVAGSDSGSDNGLETLNAFRQTVTVPYTLDLLMDADFNLESEITGDVALAFAKGEGMNFILGDSVKKPQGLMQDASLQSGARETAGSGAISWKDLLLLTGDLKEGYNPMYGMNRQTLAQLRILEDTAGNPVFQAGLAPNAPNTIAGENYAVFQDMPSISAGNYPIFYADLRMAYTIIDRTGVSIIRDEFSKKKQAIIEMTFHRYNGGQIVIKEAIKYLKIKA